MAGGMGFPCALGRAGITSRKREGDGATPLAAMRLMEVNIRPGRGLRPSTRLPRRIVHEDDGWCDDPNDRNYNRPVRLPYPASHERMMRDDALYDFCIVLDWNIAPRRRSGGSAIFLHIARPAYQPTEGCVAVSKATMRWLLPRVTARTVLKVVR